MLKSLRITNYAIIDEINIEFHKEMTAFTGETGAGKSIIIDAIGQLLGQRASADMVKTGSNKAFIEGVFDISQKASIKETLEEFGFDDIENDIVVSKTITTDGKSTCRLNYRIVNVTILKEIIGNMVDIHSQFETQYLLNQKIHIDLLDQYAANEIEVLLNEYQNQYKEYVKKKNELKKFLEKPLDQEELEYLESQLQEIEEASIKENEYDDLLNEKKQMDEYEKINQNLSTIMNELDGQYGSLPVLQSSLHTLEKLVFIPLFEKIYEEFEEGYYKIQDSYDEMQNYMQHLEFDEYRYQEIQERMFLIQRIQKKFGYSIEKINEYKSNLQQKIEVIQNQDTYVLTLENDIKKLKKQALDYALKIHEVRKKYALILEEKIMQQLHDLYMEKAIFTISIQKNDTLNSKGIDTVDFLISTNVGQSLKPLHKVASGGELSRLMLGLKIVFADVTHISTIIFDEVDTGVSGKIADRIGHKMKELSEHSQVICITHLPQVASYATHHLFVYKESTSETTYTKTKYLNFDEKINEIATMLSGNKISSSSIEAAKDLLTLNGNK